MDMGIIGKNGNSTLLRVPELEPHHQMQFSDIIRIAFLVGSIVFVEDAVGIF